MTENNSNGVDYQINFFNNSINSGSFMVFQQDENLNVEGAMSLAWMTKFAHANTQGFFTWTLNYNFVWMEKSSISSGILTGTSQYIPANLLDMNGITLTYDDGGYAFSEPTAETPAGSLYIKEDSTVPLKQANVGIGMSGSPTFVVQAQPNMNLTFTPHPEYWIAFGDFEQGQVLNLQEMSDIQSVVFPPGIFAMNVTLNMDNTWTVEPA